jgi:hypothetical protein
MQALQQSSDVLHNSTSTQKTDQPVSPDFSFFFAALTPTFMNRALFF